MSERFIYFFRVRAERKKISGSKGYRINNNLNSFTQTSRFQRAHPLMATKTKPSSMYLPPSQYRTQSEVNFDPSSRKPLVNPQVLRSLSPEDVQKMKYKIELDKQVAEKQQRRAREWQSKIERDRKYVQHQPFGRHDRTTVLKPEELEEILSKARSPSPVLEMPQQYPLYQQTQQQQQTPYMTERYNPPNDNNPSNTAFPSPRQSTYNNYPPYPSGYPPTQPQIQSEPPKNPPNNDKPDFQRFYGPNGNANPNVGTTTAQPIKGDAHDPFLLFDPNKEGQNVFNIIPQQDLYDPWGRPGAGAPLIHAPTGQRFTRYSGSLQEKLSNGGPLSFYQRERTENIEEQKRDLELERQRRQKEEMEHRSNAGDTAEWITQLERKHYPLKLHLATTGPTREFANARTRYRSDESRLLHDDLVRQAEERTRFNKLDRYNNSMAEIHHSESMNNWWGRGGGGAPTVTNRRHNVDSSFEKSRQKWTTNHLGQLVMADEETPTQIMVQPTVNYKPRHKQLSNHRNFYQAADDQD